MNGRTVYAMCAALLLMGCAREVAPPSEAEDLSARNADVEACVACGMVVREQPAPRGQVIHRNGTRVYLCSLGDLLRYLEVPSPHGKPRAVYVETLPDAHPLDDMDANWRPWQLAADAHYVVGIDRSGVMGTPIMSYMTDEAATTAAERFKGEAVSFTELKEGRTE